MCEATYMYVCSVIWVNNNKLLAGRKCDISVCAADIFKHREKCVRGKSVFAGKVCSREKCVQLLRDYLVNAPRLYVFPARNTFPGRIYKLTKEIAVFQFLHYRRVWPPL